MTYMSIVIFNKIGVAFFYYEEYILKYNLREGGLNIVESKFTYIIILIRFNSAP